jgi:hypothetical protein
MQCSGGTSIPVDMHFSIPKPQGESLAESQIDEGVV